MHKDKKVVVAMLANDVSKTLQRTYSEVMEQEIVDNDQVVMVDDANQDGTVEISQNYPMPSFISIPEIRVTAAIKTVL